MFLLENKLQSFYDEIKKLNTITLQNDNNTILSNGENILEKEEYNSNGLTKNASERESFNIQTFNSAVPEINKIIVTNPHKSNFNYLKDSIIDQDTIVKCKSSNDKNMENGNENISGEYNIVMLNIFY